MPGRHAFEYAVIRAVPRVDREEFVNCGVVLYAPTAAFLGCRLALDRARLTALDPSVDADALEGHLAGLRAICAADPAAGPVARMSASERFHWLVAPRSTVVQPSPVHAGVAADPPNALDTLFESLVARARRV